MTDSFMILVTGSPTRSQAHVSAMRFTQAAISAGVKIAGIFFYLDAVSVGSRYNHLPDDELQLAKSWRQIAKDNGIELQLCVAAASRRGVLSAEEAESTGVGNTSLAPGFTLLGLGQLAASLSQTGTKLVQFK